MATVIIKNVSTQQQYIRDLQDTLEPNEEVTISRSLGELTGMTGLNAAIDAGTISVLSTSFSGQESIWVQTSVGAPQTLDLGIPQAAGSDLGEIEGYQDGFARLVMPGGGAHYQQIVLTARTAGIAGNSLEFISVNDSEAGVTIAEAGSVITAHYQDGVSTGNDVVAALNAHSTLVTGVGSGPMTTPWAGPDDNIDFSLVGGTDPGQENSISTSNPDCPRTLAVLFGILWAAGDIIITGTNQFDEVITETFPSAPNSSSAGVKAFKTITSARKTLSTQAITPGQADVQAADIITTSALGVLVHPVGTSATVFVGSTVAAGVVDPVNATVTVSADGTSEVFVALNAQP